MGCTVALFGEAEKGEYKTAYFCRDLYQLAVNLGHPPPDSKGLHMAVQTLLYDYNLIFFRVEEEGFSIQDYLQGLRFLSHNQFVQDLTAICLPGVGDNQIFEAAKPIYEMYRSLIVTTEVDLYDYLRQ